MSRSTALILFSMVCGAGLWAQSAATSQISGTVTDPTGATVADAQVKLTQTDTGLVRTATSGADGSYSLLSLPTGPYKLEVTKQGFSTYVQAGIVLQVNSNPRIEAQLKVGAVSDQVVVEAATTMVEVHTTSVGQVIDSQRVVDLPLNGRNPTELIFLTGASAQAPNADLVSAKNYPSETPISIAGGAATGATYTLDGGTHNDPFNNLALPLPFPTLSRNSRSKPALCRRSMASIREVRSTRSPNPAQTRFMAIFSSSCGTISSTHEISSSPSAIR